MVPSGKKERILGNTTVEFDLLDYNTTWSLSLLQLSRKFKDHNDEERNTISSHTKTQIWRRTLTFVYEKEVAFLILLRFITQPTRSEFSGLFRGVNS